MWYGVLGIGTNVNNSFYIFSLLSLQFADENGVLYFETSAKDLKSLEKVGIVQEVASSLCLL